MERAGDTSANAAEEGFRLEQREVYDWVEQLLSYERGYGDVRDPDVLIAAHLIEQHFEPLSKNEFTYSLVGKEQLAIVQDKMWRQTTDGLAELSEGLRHYGGVQAVVSQDGRDCVIDLVDLRSDENYKAILVDQQGTQYPYTYFRALLIPLEDGGE